MATFLQGQTFGSTEQVTNTKMHNLVALASISNIQASELATNLLSSLPSACGKVPPQNFWHLGTCATNASLITISALTAIQLNYATYGSIATFVGARVGQRFVCIAQQASFPAIIDSTNFALSANWIPAKANDNLELLWTGSVFIEVGRTAT